MGVAGVGLLNRERDGLEAALPPPPPPPPNALTATIALPLPASCGPPPIIAVGSGEGDGAGDGNDPNPGLISTGGDASGATIGVGVAETEPVSVVVAGVEGGAKGVGRPLLVVDCGEAGIIGPPPPPPPPPPLLLPTPVLVLPIEPDDQTGMTGIGVPPVPTIGTG